MKKIFTLCVSLLALGATAMAQEVDGTFCFVDDKGNVVPDGTVIEVNTLNDQGQMVIPLFTKKMVEENAAGALYEDVSAMPNGDYSTCCFGNCVGMSYLVSNDYYSSKGVVKDNTAATIQTEWIPEAGKYASWTATLQIRVFNIVSKTVFGITTESAGNMVIGFGPTVTVNFNYSDPASISADGVTEKPMVVECLNANGQRVSSSARGLRIVRLDNGKTIKRIVR